MTDLKADQQLPGALIEEHFGWSNIHILPHPSGQALDIMFDIGPPEQPIMRKKVTLQVEAARGIGQGIVNAADQLSGGLQVAANMNEVTQMAAQAKAAEAALRGANGKGM